MIRINENYLKLKASYLFSDIAKRVAAFQQTHPEREIIKLGIGDVTRALPPACIVALTGRWTRWPMTTPSTGTAPNRGIRSCARKSPAMTIRTEVRTSLPDEIFVSDGAKCDTGNIQEIFSTDIKIAIPIGLPGLSRHQRDGRTHRRLQRRPLRWHRLSGGKPRKRVRAGSADRTGRSDIPLFSEQSHGATIDKPRLEAVGRFRQSSQGVDSL